MDALSRDHLPVLFTDDATEGCQEHVHSLLDHIIPLRDTWYRYVQATDVDPALQLVKELLVIGWPEKKESLSASCSAVLEFSPFSPETDS